MKKATFIKNAFILTATSLLLRTIGIFFRIYMSNKVGAEGMGLYQLIFSIYVLGSTFATSGSPPPSPAWLRTNWSAGHPNRSVISCIAPLR